MNDQSQMMSQAQMMGLSQAPVMSQPPMMNQPPMMSQPPIMSQPQMIGSIAQSQAMAPQPQQPPQLRMMSSQSQLPMMNRGYKVWSQQQQQQQQQHQQLSLDPSKKFQSSMKPNFTAPKPGRNNWKGKKGTDKRQDMRRVENLAPNSSMSGTTSIGGGGYKPPTLNELQSQNRMKARKFYPKKKFNNRFAPYAPRNTTSFIIRAKKSGGIASLVSPCPVTPAVLPTPIFSPSREVLGDMAKEEWGVDGYGSMKGLIRLRSPGNEDDEEEEGGGGSSESDVEEHVEVERRLDHDLSRFEMIYPNYNGIAGMEYNNVLENRVDDQDTHIAQLEEENLTLKERLFLMERELGDLRRRLQFLEMQNHMVGDVHEEVVENESENDSEGGSGAPDMCLSGKNREEVVEYMSGQEGSRDVEAESKKEGGHDEAAEVERAGDVCMEHLEHDEVNIQQKEEIKREEVRNEMTAGKDETKDEEVEKKDIKGEELRNEMSAGKDETRAEEVETEKTPDEVITGNDDGSDN